MAQTPVTNFGKVTVSIGYDAVATSIALTAGHGSRLPSTFPYPLTWWNATDNADPADDANKEIVIVTNRVGDTLTVTRAGEGTSAGTKNTGGKTYKMFLGMTKAMWDSLFTLSLSQSFRGLMLQTHPDSDKALTQVMLVHADSIVMDDGQEIKSWDLLVADLTVSGAGGLDTGTEANGVWYEIYAIYNPTTTTKKIMLHRAKDYFLDQDGSAGDDGQVALRDAAARTKIAQGFKVTNAGLVEFVDVKVVKTAAPTGNFWFTIEGNSGGVPNNTPLATSDKYDVSRLITTAGTIRIPFRTPASLSAATQYHLVLQGDYTVSAVNFMSWRCDTTAPPYANGSAATFDGATWTADVTRDFTFKVYVTRNDVAVTMPSGYVQKAKIGFDYNGAGGNLKHFFQKDRDVFCGYDDDWQVGAFSISTPTLVDLFAFLPPFSTVTTFQAYDAAGTNLHAGDLPVTDLIPGTQTTEIIGSIRTSLAAGSISPMPEITLGPYQGFMFANQSGTCNLYISSFVW